MKTRSLNVNVIGAICALTACAARVGHAQGPRDPCKSIDAVAVTAVAGVSVDTGKPISATGCVWESQKPHVMVTVSFWGPSMNGVFTPKATPGVTNVHADGIGEDARWVIAASMTTLYVKHAKDILMVRVYGIPDEAKQKSIEKTLALDVLKKL